MTDSIPKDLFLPLKGRDGVYITTQPFFLDGFDEIILVDREVDNIDTYFDREPWDLHTISMVIDWIGNPESKKTERLWKKLIARHEREEKRTDDDRNERYRLWCLIPMILCELETDAKQKWDVPEKEKYFDRLKTTLVEFHDNPTHQIYKEIVGYSQLLSISPGDQLCIEEYHTNYTSDAEWETKKYDKDPVVSMLRSEIDKLSGYTDEDCHVYTVTVDKIDMSKASDSHPELYSLNFGYISKPWLVSQAWSWGIILPELWGIVAEYCFEEWDLGETKSVSFCEPDCSFYDLTRDQYDDIPKINAPMLSRSWLNSQTWSKNLLRSKQWEIVVSYINVLELP